MQLRIQENARKVKLINCCHQPFSRYHSALEVLHTVSSFAQVKRMNRLKHRYDKISSFPSTTDGVSGRHLKRQHTTTLTTT